MHPEELRDILKDIEVDEFTFARILFLVTTERAMQAWLAHQLQDKIISPEEYLDALTASMKFNMNLIDRILGRERFLKVFGEAGLHPEGMINRELFLEEQR